MVACAQRCAMKTHNINPYDGVYECMCVLGGKSRIMTPNAAELSSYYKTADALMVKHQLPILSTT